MARALVYADVGDALSWRRRMIVATRRSVPSIRIAGLQRAARLAGESFGHEDLPSLPRLRRAALQPSLWWLVAALAAISGLAALSLR